MKRLVVAFVVFVAISPVIAGQWSVTNPDAEGESTLVISGSDPSVATISVALSALRNSQYYAVFWYVNPEDPCASVLECSYATEDKCEIYCCGESGCPVGEESEVYSQVFEQGSKCEAECRCDNGDTADMKLACFE